MWQALADACFLLAGCLCPVEAPSSITEEKRDGGNREKAITRTARLRYKGLY